MGRTYRSFAGMIAAARYRSPLRRYLVAFALPFAALWLTSGVVEMKTAPFFPLFTLAIAISAIYGGGRPGFAALAVSVVLNAIAIPPAFSIPISDFGSAVRLLIFAIVGAVIATLIAIISEVQSRVESERERLQVTLSSIGDAVIATDAQGRITFLNRIAEEATGWTSAEALHQPLEIVFDIVNETTREVVENPVRKVFQHGTVVGLANHTVLRRRDGTEIPIDDSAAPIRDRRNSITGVVLVFRDISARKQADAALLRTEKLATVGRLASTIAHEINNPLEAVMNLLYLVADSPALAPELQGHIATAQEELARAAHVSKQSLSFYRPLQARGSVDVSTAIDEVLALYDRRLAQKNVFVEKRIARSPMAVTTSGDLRQVLANLIANALDAVGASGRVLICARYAYYGSEPMVRITVADDGHGIGSADRQKIFEPFYTTKQNVGTGLGLWVTRQILEAGGGRIRVRSIAARGSVFHVLLPAGAATEAAATNAE